MKAEGQSQPSTRGFKIPALIRAQQGRTQSASHSQDLSFWGVCHLWLLWDLIQSLYVCFWSICGWMSFTKDSWVSTPVSHIELYKPGPVVWYLSTPGSGPSPLGISQLAIVWLSSLALPYRFISLSVSLNISFPCFCLFLSFALSLYQDR